MVVSENNNSKTCAIILAAGNGKRMKSEKPKALCEVLFKPMIDWVCESVIKSNVNDLCFVIGFGGEILQKHITTNNLYKKCKTEFVVQTEILGTGHAVKQANSYLDNHKDSDVLILCGDAPFLDKETIEKSYAYHKNHNNDATVITATIDDPTGYGRIGRRNGKVIGIIEHKDTDDKTVEIKEVNSGAYWFNVKALQGALDELKNNNSQNEFYLTDTLEILNKQGFKVNGFVSEHNEVILGANDRKGLLKLNKIASRKIINRFLDDGVEFISTDGVIIGNDVEIAAGTRIMPNSIIIKGTKIGTGCIIGPNSYIENSIIGDNVVVNSSQIYNSKVANNKIIGPFDNLTK